MVTEAELTRTIYVFGSVKNGPYGYMTFSPRGLVTSRYEPNEHKYTFDGEVLTFFSTSGAQTSQLKVSPDGRSFDPYKGDAHYLHPMLTLDPPQGKSLSKPIFVNTLPKAGTYLMERALTNIGYRSLGLHVLDGNIHDNRGVPEDEIHWDPASRAVPVTAWSTSGLLRNGEFAVGHLEDRDQIYSFVHQRVKLLSVIREPRSMLMSHFVFSQKRVKPDRAAGLWQSMEGVEAFKGFLLSHPVEAWMRQLDTIASEFKYLRYEDLRAGKLDRKAVGTTLHARLQGGLKQALGQKTATFMEGKRDGAHAFFDDPAVKAYLDAYGVNDLSRQYWPELN